MKTEQYLSQIIRYDKMITNKLAEIHRLRLMSCGITAPSDNERVQTSGDKDKISVIVSKIVDMEHEVDELTDMRCEIVKQIESIADTDMYDVLAKRYILDKDFKVIMAEKKKSKRQIFNVFENAKKEFEKEYGYAYLNK